MPVRPASPTPKTSSLSGLAELEAHFHKALADMDAQRWNSAETVLSHALEIDPSKPGLWFNRAWCRVHQERSSLAQDDLTELLALQPAHAEGLRLLGRLQLADGNLTLGAATLRLAWSCAPHHPELADEALRAAMVVPGETDQAAQLSEVLARQGLLQEATAADLIALLCCEEGGRARAHRLCVDWCQLPDHCVRQWMFEAWVTSCAARGFHEETVVAAGLWLRHSPDSVQALDFLVQALAARGDYDAALPLALERVKRHPQDGEGLVLLVDCLYASMDTGARMAAATLLAHALNAEPDNATLWCLKGEINGRLFLREESESDFRRALALEPDSVIALTGLAGALSQSGRYEEALSLLADRAAGDPQRLEGPLLNALGNILRACGRVQESEVVLRAGLDRTQNPVFAVNLAFALLEQGRYQEGFAHYLRRRDTRRLARTWHRALKMGARPWSGRLEDARGQHLLVTAENGIGDTFQFARYLPVLVREDVQVTLAAQPRTERLLSTLGPGVAVIRELEELPPAQLVCDVHDLPGFLGARLEVPETLGQAHCISADKSLVGEMRRRLGPARGLRVALGWRGTRSSMAERSIDLACFAELTWPGVEWFSLQHGPLSPQDQAAAQTLGMHHHSWSFDEAAAAMELMDVVVSIDTVYAHLAGALGLAPVVLLNAVVDWRWAGDKPLHPWYPKAMLLRASTLDDWSTPLLALQHHLAELSQDWTPPSHPDSSVVVPDSFGPPGRQSQGREDFERAYADRQWASAAAFVKCWMEADTTGAEPLLALQRLLPHLARPVEMWPWLERRLLMQFGPEDLEVVSGEVKSSGMAGLAGSETVPISGNTEGTDAPLFKLASFASRALRSQPGEALHAQTPGLVDTLQTAGLLFLHQRRSEIALPLLAWVADRRPEDPWSWIHLARVHHLVNEGPATLRCAKRAVALAPQLPAARTVLYMGLAACHRYEEAHREVDGLWAHAQSRADRTGMAEALTCRSAVLRGQGRLEEAEKACHEALTFDPMPEVQGYLGALRALRGDYARAATHLLHLQSHKTRLGGRVHDWMSGGTRPWSGRLDEAVGRRLVVEADNGAGDTFQFARFLPRLASLGVRVELHVPRGLVEVMRFMSLPEDAACSLQVLDIHAPQPPHDEPPDLHVHLEALPWVMGVTLEQLPSLGTPAYLRPPKAAAAVDSSAPGQGSALHRLHIGLAWQGQRDGGGVRRTSLAEVTSAFEAAGLLGRVEVTALSIEALSPEESAAAQRLGLRTPGWTFDEAASALRHLDLVLSVDTSHAHLAGAVGVPCWVLLNHVPDWRWGQEGTTTPWYPLARLFRQQQPGDWGHPLSEVAQALRQRLTRFA